MITPAIQAPLHVGFPFEKSLRNFLAGQKAARARRAVFEKVYGELSAMTNRDLADINVSRHAIRDVARAAAQQI